MEKITILDYGDVSPMWLSHTLNELSKLQQIRRDIYLRLNDIRSLLTEPGFRTEADSIYHQLFAEGVLAEFKKIDEQINRDIHTLLASITNGKKAGFVDIAFPSENDAANQISLLTQEVERFRNLEENYNAAREALWNTEKDLPVQQHISLTASFDRDFEREKAIFADKISHFIQRK